MLEKIISKLIMKNLKDYIKEINSSQMEMALWKGAAKFKNLQLKNTALTQHMIPFYIINGILGYIEVIFPWKNLSNEPTAIFISDVYIVLTPIKEILIKKDLQPNQSAISFQTKSDRQSSAEDEENAWQSIIDSIFDNITIDIKNIHVRLEIPGEFNTLAIGLVIPLITLRTVDADNHEVKARPNQQIVRKQLSINGLSVYFDTLSDPIDINDFVFEMRNKMTEYHQYVLHPFIMTIIMMHARDNKNPLKNQIDILIDKMALDLDYLQCRAIMKIAHEWNLFERQRYFAQCIRPPVFQNTAQLWGYTFRCAIAIARPYNFKPKQALNILKHRKEYLKRMRKAQNQSSFAIIQNFKNRRVKDIEDEIGEEATFFLQNYCEAVLAKEERMRMRNNDDELSHNDLEKLNRIRQSDNGKFFSKDSFSICFGLNNFEIGLNYSRETPLVKIIMNAISASYTRDKTLLSIFMKLQTIKMVSYSNNDHISLLDQKHCLPNFISLDCRSQEDNQKMFIDVIHIDSFVFRPNYQTINTALDFFFTDRNKTEKDPATKQLETSRVFRFDAFESLNKLLIFRNHRISIRNHSFSILYPFLHDNQIYDIELTVSNVDFAKLGNIYYPKFAPEKKMDMGINLTIDHLSFAKHSVIKEFVLDAQYTASFRKNDMDLDAKILITPISIVLSGFPFHMLKSLMNNIQMLTILSTVKNSIAKRIISFNKVKLDISTIVQSLSIRLKEKEVDAFVKFKIMESQVDFVNGLPSIQIALGPFGLIDKGKLLVQSSDDFSISLKQKEINQPFTLSMTMIKPYVNCDMIWLMQLFNVIDLYLAVFGLSIFGLENNPNNGSASLHPDIHLNINIISPYIQISPERGSPYVTIDTLKVFDDEHFTMTVSVDSFQISRELNPENNPCGTAIKELVTEGHSSIEIVNENDLDLIKDDDRADELIRDIEFIENISAANLIQVFKPATFSIIIALKNEINITMHVPPIELKGSQKDYEYIVPFIIRLLTVIPLESTSTAKVSLNMTVDGLTFLICDDECPFIRFCLDQTTISVENEKDQYVTLKSGRVSAYQIYNDLYPSENISDKVMLSVDYFNFGYESRIKNNADVINIELPECHIGLSERLIQLIPYFTNFDYPPNPIKYRGRPTKILILTKPLSISFFTSRDEFLDIELGSTNLDLLFDENNAQNSEMDISLNKIICSTSCFNQNIFEIDHEIRLLVSNQVLTSHFHPMSVTISLPLIMDIVDFFFPLQTIVLPTTSETITENDSIIIPFDLDISIDKISITALTSMYRCPYCIGTIVNPTIVLNSSESIAAFSVQSIVFSSGYEERNQKKFIDISGLYGTFSFNSEIEDITDDSLKAKLQKLSKDKSTFHNDLYEIVSQHPHKPFAAKSIDDVLVDVYIGATDIVYTQQMALAIIGCFIPRPKEQEQLSLTSTQALLSSTSIGDSVNEITELPKEKREKVHKPKQKSSLKWKMNISSDSFSLTLTIIEPIAFFKIQNLSIRLTEDQWDVIVKTALIQSPDQHFMKLQIPLFECPPDNDLIRFSWKGEVMNIFFEQSTLFFDYEFWIPMISFITQSPFLHIQSIYAGKEHAAQESISIPFKIKLNADKFHIVLPVTLNYDTCQMLHIQMGYTASLDKNIIQASINDLVVHVSDQIKKIDFSPIIYNMSIGIKDSTFDNQKISFHATISPIKIVMSAFDFILIGLIASSFNEAIKRLVVAADNSPVTTTKGERQPFQAELDLNVGKMKILVVKDNRSSSRFTPIFKIKNTPIELKLSTTNNVIISLDLSPYISFFNELTGQWDLIIEPLAMKLAIDFSYELLGINMRIIKPFNINLPTVAISQFLTLWKEINSNISQKDIVYEELPTYWLQNNLGTDITIKYKNKDNQNKEIVAKRLETTPMEEIMADSQIAVSYNNSETIIKTRYLIFPAIFDKSFAVIRKPHKGGTMIQFNPPVQLINKLNIDVTLYEKVGDDFRVIHELKSGQKCPLIFDNGKAKDFSFTNPKYKSLSKNLIMRMSPFDTSTLNVSLIKDGIKIRCIVTTEIESQISKVFKLLPFVVATNLLPFTLYFKFNKTRLTSKNQQKEESSSGIGSYIASDDSSGVSDPDHAYKILHIDANQTHEMLLIDPNTNQFDVALSLTENEFLGTAIYKIKKTISAIPIYPEGTIAYKAETDEQLRLVFFVPCVFYNMCVTADINIKEVGAKQPIETTIPKDGQSLLWCPPTFINANDQLSVLVSTDSTEPVEINCLEFRKGHLYLQSKENDGMYTGLRYQIHSRNNITIITFSTLLIIKNELNRNLKLQPLETIPKNFQDDLNSVGFLQNIQGSSQSIIKEMSQSGAFLVWIDGFWNSPALSLLEKRKIVFKMHKSDTSDDGNQKYEVFEAEIFDDNLSFIAVFRKASFPTPILIANQLRDLRVEVYQTIDQSHFIIEPESTSMFAFDEPLGYPNANLIIKGWHFNISLIESTEQILLKDNLNRARNKILSQNLSKSSSKGSQSSSNLQLETENDSELDNSYIALIDSPVYVKIKQNTSGIKTVFISSEKEDEPVGFSWKFGCEIPSLFISIIDLQMREFCLLSLTEMKARLDILPIGTAFQFELGELQIDDQNPLAPNPVIFHGRNGRTKNEKDSEAFLRLDALLTSDTKPLHSFKYISTLMQRIDILVDSSFLSDAINMSMKLAKPIKLPIQPVMRKKENDMDSNDTVVTYNWLEVSPIFLLMNYKNLTGRPTTIDKMIYVMRFIPSIATTKIMFPGVVIAHITDRLDFIIEKVSNDYKTAALEQVLESLGTSGKILTTFGVTATIAEKLDIQMKSELTNISSTIDNLQAVTSEEFDNRREINGYFSQETLSALQASIEATHLRQSTVIQSVLGLNNGEQSSTNDNSVANDLMIRDFTGSGFGHGIVGVLKKTTIDTMDDVKVMSGVERKRVPRAFPSNRIEQFDEGICIAQMVIQTYEKNFEKILLTTKNDETGEYVCVTREAIYFILHTLDTISRKIKIKDIKSMRIDASQVVVEYGILKNTEVIRCYDQYEAECFKIFLESQILYSDLFVKSLV